ncbi:hypothetical protein [Hyphomicrobium sp.]|uniref:hypothetical protein n=1 Tax=Hyphomicrobium sp. TaxID=82 RepID=UPI002C374EF1|nr:hypothetical protein [Hyphomicrobium sp.]HRN87586.1 hypothetical protein [Hyphomicrobium sp.]HRQ26891.1 hypothetical protein [Hyphomicrobium sp.]
MAVDPNRSALVTGAQALLNDGALKAAVYEYDFHGFEVERQATRTNADFRNARLAWRGPKREAGGLMRCPGGSDQFQLLSRNGCDGSGGERKTKREGQRGGGASAGSGGYHVLGFPGLSAVSTR